MDKIPIYLKTGPDQERPADPEFYLVARDQVYLCRNHPFFQTDAPIRRPIGSLAAHEPECKVRYPKLGVAALEFVIGFFGKVFERHGSEAIVLLLWDQDRQRYRLQVPEQEATVWESSLGTRSPLDVRYTVPPLPRRHLLLGSIHCHGDIGAYSSATDRHDERYRDGIHAIVGYIEREPPAFHLELAVDGHRFPLGFKDIFRGYRKRRGLIPREWLDKVKIKVERPRWYSPPRSYPDYGYYGSSNKPRRE